jgi:transcriptional regulator with XRE-family HTH domain
MIISPEELRKILSFNIKKQREIMEISQEKLAELADLSAQTINDIEGCRMWVSDKTISKLCRALNVNAYQLLLPKIGEKNTAQSQTETLLNFQKNLKNNINIQFEELFKTGVFH